MNTKTDINSLGFAKPPADTRVVVAMSGGVDSSVCAAMLAREGYEVIGLTMQLYDHGAALKKKGACCAGQDIYDARRVSEMFDFPHYVLDYESKFSDGVMEDFADTYLQGATPIPCVRCNQTVKFKDLLTMAKELGADCMATGHYIRRVDGPDGPELHRAFDGGKDQSYFLFATTKEQLAFLRFPLGGQDKDETRRLAVELGLDVASKPDSQDICFVPDGNYADVIRKLRPEAETPGNIVHLDGTVLGEHNGIINFTVGQRRGLGIAVGEPLFVTGINAVKNEVVVGPREALLVGRVYLKEINWLGAGEPDPARLAGQPVNVKLRSMRPPAPAVFAADHKGQLCIDLADGEEGVAPGQACVFYDPAGEGTRVLGGGWITGTESVYNRAAA